MNEVRPGTYIFNDRNTVGVSAASLERLRVVGAGTVVSTSVSGHAIIDGGSKTFSSDRYQAEDGRGFGLVKEDPAAEIERLFRRARSFEHRAFRAAIQRRRALSVIPNHVCTR